MRLENVILALLLSLVTITSLVGCGAGQATETVPAEEVPVVAQAVGTVVAEGVVEPARWTELRTEGGGKVIEVPVKTGDRVSKGDLLVQLDPSDAELAVQRAEVALALAEATLMQVKAGARPEEIAVTKAQLEATQASLAQAAARRDRLTEGEAEVDVASAQAAWAAALAEQKQTQNAHGQTLKCFDVTLSDGSEQTICPMLGETEERARYAWQTAEGKLDAAEARLEAARRRANAQVRDAQAGVAEAAAQRDALESRLELQKAGSTSEQIAAAEAEVAKAEAALEAAKAALDDTAVRASFDGTVAEVNVEAGDTATAGEALVTVATLDQLRVRTQDLTELDVVEISVGQPAVVTLDAFPDRSIEGHVARIDQQSEDYRGDVTYPVIVELEEMMPELRWGMTVLVEIDVE